MSHSRSLLMGATMVLLAAACSESPTSPSEVVPGRNAKEMPATVPAFTVNPGSLEFGMSPPGGVTTGSSGDATAIGGQMLNYTDIKSGNFSFLGWTPGMVGVTVNGSGQPLFFDNVSGGGDDEVAVGATWSGSISIPLNGQPTQIPVRVVFSAPGLVSAASLDTVGVQSPSGAVVVIPGISSVSIHVAGEASINGMWMPMQPAFDNLAQQAGQPLIASVSVMPSFLWKLKSCDAGTYLDTSAGGCQSSPAGSYSAGGYVSSATLCAAGTYQPDTGQSSCIAASAGYYVNQPGQTSQTACGSNGKYQPDTGQTGCLSAPPGTYATGSAQTAVTKCTAGHYASGYSNTSCAAAPRGTYVDADSAANPTACAAGSYNNGTGQSSCQLAGPGYYVPTTGAFTPTKCPAGSYSDTQGSTSCTLAPAGSYAPQPSGLSGATGSTLCAPGTFTSTAGQASCTPADIGYYVSGSGATSQTPCAIGYTNNSIASTSCVKMDPVVAYDALISAAQSTPGVAASEVNKLINARKLFVGGKSAAACKAIDGFVAYVNRQTGKSITSSNAAMLIRKTQDADVAIGC